MRPAQPAAGPTAEPAQLAGDPAAAPRPADPEAGEPVGDDSSWPGVALPAGWFLRAQPPVPAGRPESRAAAPGTADETNAGLDRITSGPLAPEPEEPSGESSADLPSDQGLQPDAGLRPDGDAQVDARAQRGAGAEPPEDGSPVVEDGPLDDVTSRPGLWPIASSWPNASSGAVPSPRREPDGTWSSPLTPRPPGRPQSPAQARYGRPGGPGIQPGRSSEPGLSPWQRSHQLWAETGVQWEQDPSGQARSLPAGSLPRRTPSSAARRAPAQARHQAPFTPPPALRQAPPHAPPQVPAPRPAPAQSPLPAQVPRQAPGRHTRPAPRGDEQPGTYPPDDRYLADDHYAPDDRYAPEPEAAWTDYSHSTLGAPVFSDPLLDSEDDQAREDRWADDRPPIWERPPGLTSWTVSGQSARTAGPGQHQGRPPARPASTQAGNTASRPSRSQEGRPGSGPGGRPRAEDTLLLDHQLPSRRRSGSGRRGRRAATIVVPALVLVAVAVLALALLTGHVLKFGPLTGDKHKSQGISSVAPQLPLAAVTLDTYPGQDKRGVFQTINRVVASGNTIVTMGSQTSDGVVRQQFLVSTNAGGTWRLA
ncbi:MAG TPA: hypothetical protein VFW50_19280, partial [Streptosporangiaceae bacterium]|nr:hypothetical protein [Streptosporangiaceae bacterium]